MINYNWQTTSLYTNDFAEQKDYVVSVRYEIIATDGQYISLYQSSSKFKQIIDNPNYIPYEKLTNDIVIGWVKNEFTDAELKLIYSSLESQINNQKNPAIVPTKKPLPF